jgi:hypothetical protein
MFLSVVYQHATAEDPLEDDDDLDNRTMEEEVAKLTEEEAIALRSSPWQSNVPKGPSSTRSSRPPRRNRQGRRHRQDRITCHRLLRQPMCGRRRTSSSTSATMTRRRPAN